MLQTGFGLFKSFTSNVTPSEVVFFDTADPNTGGTVFDPNTPEATDTLYVSSSDASTWIWNGSAYVGYTAPTTSSTPFYLWGTTIDAGSNKTASISRFGQISVTNALGYLSGYSQIYQYGFRSFNNISTSLFFGTSSDTPTSSVKRSFSRSRGTRVAPTNIQNGDTVNDLTESSLSDNVYREYTEATENHIASTSVGVKKIFQSTKNGSATLEDRMEFTGDGYVKLNGAYTLPNVDGTTGQVMKTDGAGNVTFGKVLPSVQSVVSSASITPTSNYDLIQVTAQVGALTINNPTGTYANGQNFLIRLDGDGSAITFDTKYIAFGSALPTTTTVGKTTLIGCTYNSNNDTFECLNSVQQ